MEHIRTTTEQSVILKNVGYDVPDTHYYSTIMSNTKELEPHRLGVEKDFNSTASFRFTRPKLTDVATWLRTVHGWHVSVVSENKNKFWTFRVTDCEGFEYIYGQDDNDKILSFNTHDLALSNGIDFILTKLKNND